jgi:hypothetical protein
VATLVVCSLLCSEILTEAGKSGLKPMQGDTNSWGTMIIALIAWRNAHARRFALAGMFSCAL